jgi:hypothetical protein
LRGERGLRAVVQARRTEREQVREILETQLLGPFMRDSDTSLAAAIDNYSRAQTQRFRVLEALARAGRNGMTRDELEVVLELDGNSVRPRVWELIPVNAIEETPRKRETRTGSKAHVLVITVAARTALAEVRRARRRRRAKIAQ